MPGISASVGVGGFNRAADVLIVQQMLTGVRALLGQSAIDVDGYIGPQTNGAIKQFQTERVGASDGRIDPLGPTLQLLNQLLGSSPEPPQPTADVIHCGPSQYIPGGSDDIYRGGRSTAMLGFALTSASVGGGAVAAPAAAAPAASITPLQKALLFAPIAGLQVAAVGGALQKVRNLFQTGQTKDIDTAKGLEEYRALCTHFKFDKHTDPLKYLSELGKTYSLIGITITKATTVFTEDMSNLADFGNAVVGGIASPNDPWVGRIRFCPSYLKMGPLFATGVIVHEGAHFVDKLIGHVASELPAPDGWPVGSTTNYANMTPLQAQHNAYSYAQFALHLWMGFDKRLLAPRNAAGELTFPE